MTQERREARTGTNPWPSGAILLPDPTRGPGLWYTPTVWTVSLWFRKEFRDWLVQGKDHLGCVVPSEGPRSHKTLAKARDDAERLFATLTGSPRRETWPYR